MLLTILIGYHKLIQLEEERKKERERSADAATKSTIDKQKTVTWKDELDDKKRKKKRRPPNAYIYDRQR